MKDLKTLMDACPNLVVVPIGDKASARDMAAGGPFPIEDAPKSWKPEVQTIGGGETWSGNALRFATQVEAEANARDLMRRWTLVAAARAAPSDDPVNYKFIAGQLTRLTEEN